MLILKTSKIHRYKQKNVVFLNIFFFKKTKQQKKKEQTLVASPTFINIVSQPVFSLTNKAETSQACSQSPGRPHPSRRPLAAG